MVSFETDSWHLHQHIMAHQAPGNDNIKSRSREDCPSPPSPGPPSFYLDYCPILHSQITKWGEVGRVWSKAQNSLWKRSNHILRMSLLACCLPLSPPKWSGIRPEGLTSRTHVWRLPRWLVPERLKRTASGCLCCMKLSQYKKMDEWWKVDQTPVRWVSLREKAFLLETLILKDSCNKLEKRSLQHFIEMTAARLVPLRADFPPMKKKICFIALLFTTVLVCWSFAGVFLNALGSFMHSFRFWGKTCWVFWLLLHQFCS